MSVKNGQLLINGVAQGELTPEMLKDAVPRANELKVPAGSIATNRIILPDNLDVLLPGGDRVSFNKHMTDLFGQRYLDYSYAVGDAFMQLRNKIADIMDYPELKKVAIGLSIDNSYRGVSIKVPFEGNFLNHIAPESNDIFESAYGMLGTMLHEFAHFKVRDHTQDFPQEMQRILYKLDAATKSGKFDFDRFRHNFAYETQKYADIISSADVEGEGNCAKRFTRDCEVDSWFF